MKRSLARLLRPKSIAVIGGGWGLAVIEQCLKMGFDGDVWPVHPSREQAHGLPCFKSVTDLPSPPDASFVGVNRHLTIETVRDLSAAGAGGAVCFASGFAEAEDDRAAGADLQANLINAAGDMPVLGPNCYGLINYLDGALLWPDQHGGKRVANGVAILAQSSNILINLTMQRRGLPMAYCLTAGNQAQTGLADLAKAVLEDDRVTALGIHIEGISDIPAFEVMAARARELRKPIVVLKVGKSEQAQAATISHTASLAGSDAASRAFFRRLGIAQVDGLTTFLETLKLLHVHGPLPGRRLSSMSCSGGEASLIADAATSANVDFPALVVKHRQAIKATLSDLVTIANPLDYHTFIWDDAERMTATYAAMFEGGFDLNLLLYDFPHADRTDAAAWECGQTALIAATGQTGARTAMVSSLPENMPEFRAETLIAQGIAPLMGFEDALIAVASAADIHDAYLREAEMPVLDAGSGTNKPITLTEVEAKKRLSLHGLAIPESGIADTPMAAGEMVEKIGGRVVLKGQGFAHKTEAGAVALNLQGAQQVQQAAEAMHGATGYLVEQMVPGAVAELIIGVVRDPVYGFALTIGAGGILTELLEDSATLLIPASRASVREAIQRLRVNKLLSGYRGKLAGDLDTVLDAIEAVQKFTVANATTLEELDINPLIVTNSAAVAVDALIVLRGEAQS